MTELMIEAIGISRKFGDVTALDDVNVHVPKGSVLGLLGHNGAGKTTLINVLTTVLPPHSGKATVAGFDVVHQAHQVRARIGVAGQFTAVDEQLTGTDNLVLVARLLGARKREAKEKANQLMELLDLTGATGRSAKTYSGGMRRRLDLAASLVGQPDVIFLDEPTTGLDPASRIEVWKIIEGLVSDSTTVLLTTQHLEEADRLANSITVLSRGVVVAAGTAAELKAKVGLPTVHVTLTAAEDAPLAMDSLECAGLYPVHDESRRAVSTPVASSTGLATVVRALDRVGVQAAELSFNEPSLDDVYVTLAKSSVATTVQSSSRTL
ncbi:MAG: ATP-binding cassette domain-containing protein [Actinomycetota bacterium]|nr:ATP-binding cassette domain-containing protein [Actinomycetota bacterium]